jgi:hypothetical protein
MISAGFPQIAGFAGRIPENLTGSPSPAAARMSLMDLGRIAWIVTVLVCLVTAVILLLEGYYGYAAVTIAVAVSAFINLV